MFEEKKYYWLKLKESFMNSDTVEFLMAQKNGANYVVLYQMLCLKTINTGGRLERKLGEILIPYDALKIQRACKYFDLDTVIVAFELYKKLGLILQEENGVFYIADFEHLVGSETSKAQIMRKLRAKQKQKSGNIVTEMLPKCYPNVTQEKEIEKEIDIEIDIDKESVSKDTPRAQDKVFVQQYGKYKNVRLTNIEYDKLANVPDGLEAVEFLSEYIELKGYKVKSHYLAIRKWTLDAVRERRIKAAELKAKEDKLSKSGNSFLDDMKEILKEKGEL